MTLSYEDFVASKFRAHKPCGIDLARDALHGSLFPHQRDLVTWALRRGRAAIFADTGLGKALADDTPVLTPTGFVPIASLQPGDSVIGANGKPTRVLGVFPQGERDAYRVAFSDGASVVCDGEHLWNVRTATQKSRGCAYQTITLNQIAARGLGAGGGGRKSRWFIPMTSAVEFDESELPLHPYLLGCLIGDGCITHGVPRISSADSELIERLRDVMPMGLELRKRRYSKYDYDFTGGMRGGHARNVLVEILSELGLWGHDAAGKFIPDAYKFSSVETRTWLLQGLMDTDGSVWMTGEIPVLEYCTVSKRLAEDVLFLVQSLGGKAKIATKRTRGQLAYRMHPSLPPGVRPFALTRKAEKWRDREKYVPTRSIRHVDPAGRVRMTCIKVAADDGLFVINDCIVTHNTPMQLEWSRHIYACTDRDILILAPLAVAQQTAREGARLDLNVTVCRESSDVQPGLNVTNYDRLHKFDPKRFGAVVLDESSCIKHENSKTLRALLDAFRDTPYRLCCTATPSPNDYTELGTHAEFLGVCTRTEMLAEFFVHDGGETQKWRLKGHARKQFWRWVAAWGAMLRKPSDLAHDDAAYELPPLTVTQHTIDADHSQAQAAGMLFAQEASTLTDRRNVKRATIDARVAELAARVNASRDPWVVWCELNAEQDAIADALGDECVSIYGTLSADEKEALYEQWHTGNVRVLLSKPSIFGFGVNMQRAAHMAFVGISDSYESYYQAVRRCWRFGQTRPVDVHVFASELEGAVVRNLERKQREAETMANELAAETRDAVRANVRGLVRETNAYEPRQKMTVPGWMTTEVQDV